MPLLLLQISYFVESHEKPAEAGMRFVSRPDFNPSRIQAFPNPRASSPFTLNEPCPPTFSLSNSATHTPLLDWGPPLPVPPKENAHRPRRLSSTSTFTRFNLLYLLSMPL